MSCYCNSNQQPIDINPTLAPVVPSKVEVPSGNYYTIKKYGHIVNLSVQWLHVTGTIEANSQTAIINLDNSISPALDNPSLAKCIVANHWGSEYASTSAYIGVRKGYIYIVSTTQYNDSVYLGFTVSWSIS